VSAYILSVESRRIVLSLVFSILYSFLMSAVIVSSIGSLGGLLASLTDMSAMFLKIDAMRERMQNTSTIKPKTEH